MSETNRNGANAQTMKNRIGRRNRSLFEKMLVVVCNHTERSTLSVLFVGVFLGQKMRVVAWNLLPTFVAVVPVAHAEAGLACKRATAFPTSCRRCNGSGGGCRGCSYILKVHVVIIAIRCHTKT